jgi:ribosomal protein L32
MPPPINLDESRLNPRICLCDQHLFPLSCEECDVNTGTACALHMTVTCNGIECEKRFHKDCLCTGLSTYATLDELRDSHTCMECSCRADAATEDQPYDYFPLHSLNDIDSMNDRLLRFGMDPLPPNAQTPQRRKARTSMKNLKDALDHCNRDLDGLPALVERGIDPSDILDSKPRSLPTPVHMAPDSIDSHVRAGRRAEFSLSLYGVNSCSCCGSVKPHHADPEFPKGEDAPFQRMHLLNESHHAWHCTCQGYCKGSQFYASKRPSVIDAYKREHGGQSPQEYRDAHPNQVTEATLCHKCYTEVTSKNVLGTYQLYISILFAV